MEVVKRWNPLFGPSRMSRNTSCLGYYRLTIDKGEAFSTMDCLRIPFEILKTFIVSQISMKLILRLANRWWSSIVRDIPVFYLPFNAFRVYQVHCNEEPLNHLHICCFEHTFSIVQIIFEYFVNTLRKVIFSIDQDLCSGIDLLWYILLRSSSDFHFSHLMVHIT